MPFMGKNILVLGAGLSGCSVAEALADQGAKVTINDYSIPKKELTYLADKNIRLVFGRQDESLLAGVENIIVSPGISIYNPLIKAAKERGIIVMSEIEVAYKLAGSPIIAITGTNGKTTTTTLVGEIIKAGGKKTVVGGNIGQALSKEVLAAGENGVVVAEISSFQLEGVIDFKPVISAVLNITPDHIDRHKTLEIYRRMKMRIFQKQTAENYTVLNYDDLTVRAMADRTAAKAVFFSRLVELPQGAFVKAGMLVLKWEEQLYELCGIKELKLRGVHNVENALAAAIIAFLAGVDADADRISKVLRDFAGVEHRIEPVAFINGVEYYNDSKATNPESAIKALEAFAGQVILIAGGRDKNTDLTELMQIIKAKTDYLILIGEAKERFYKVAREYGINNIQEAKTLGEAVTFAYNLAKPPQAVLLSPACASYDMFNNFEERGKSFKDLVHLLVPRR